MSTDSALSTADRTPRMRSSRSPRRSHRPDPDRAAGECLEIGLVNNMPDAALDATERQFRSLFAAVAGDGAIKLTMYSLPEIQRSEFGQQQVSKYAPFDDIWDREFDGLVVTGTEPRHPDLTDEPYWATLTKLIDWADEHTRSTVWSCLAAHAALLYLDGINRRPLIDKRFGVFECERVSDHPLTASTPARLRIPHSRWNDISEDDLTERGYHVLTRSEEAGVDAFVKQRKSLFVFFQGHPEYDAPTLLLEYRRDVGRFLRAERPTYPPLPAGYFDAEMSEALAQFRERAVADRREELLAEFPIAAAAARVTNTWRSTAEALYRNWLAQLRQARRAEAGA